MPLTGKQYGTKYGQQLEVSPLGDNVSGIATIRTKNYDMGDGGSYWLDEDEAREVIDILEQAIEEHED